MHAKSAGLIEAFKRLKDAPHAVQVRKNLADTAKRSEAAHQAAAHAQKGADQATHYSALAAARTQAKSSYAKHLPGPVSAKDARKAFEASKPSAPSMHEKRAADVKGKLLHIAQGAASSSPEQIAAARVAANAAHAKYLGTAMPTPEWLRSTYGHTTPDAFRAQYAKSIEATGVQHGPRGVPESERGVESYITRGPDGSQRVSDAGLGYLHADRLRAETAALTSGMKTRAQTAAAQTGVPLSPEAALQEKIKRSRSNERSALHGGLEGMMNHAANLDIHGRPAVNEVAESGSALAQLVPKDPKTRALWDRISAADDQAFKIRMQSPPTSRRLDAVRPPAPAQSHIPTPVDLQAPVRAAQMRR